MLPRPLPSEVTVSSDTEREDGGDADQSMDGSSSCKHIITRITLLNLIFISAMIIDDVLPPLELARRRKSILSGPRP